MGLNVLAKRPDGYHEVDMIMQSIDLYDELFLEYAEELTVVADQELSTIPMQENLAWRAAKLLQETSACGLGARIVLEKNIPVAAGLAGGSSDAAAVLRGLNRLWGLGYSSQQLEVLGSKIGSDIPFCIEGKTQRARGRGELLSKVASLPVYDLVLVKPNFPVHTAEIYRNFNVAGEHDSAAIEIIIDLLSRGETEQLWGNMANALESVTIKMHPVIAKVKELLTSKGANISLMSGSGPTIFAIAPSRAVAESMAAATRERFDDMIVLVTNTRKEDG